MRIILLIGSIFLSFNSFATSQEFLLSDINIDKSNSSIKIKANKGFHMFNSFSKDLKIKDNKDITLKLMNSYKGEYTYGINRSLFSKLNKQFSFSIIYPEGKEIEISYQHIDFSKEKDISIYKNTSKKNIKSNIIEDIFYDHILYYYIEYN